MTEGFMPPHGGYQNLISYQKSEIVFDATVYFCDRFIDKRSRAHDQMVQASRSGKQNIIEGSMASGTSKETEIKLTNVARASLEELLADYRDFLRTRGLPLWDKNDSKAQVVRKLGYGTHVSYATYRSQIEQTSRKLRRTRSFASSTRPTIYWTSRFEVWKKPSSKKAACASA
jgi:four helix bundle protein